MLIYTYPPTITCPRKNALFLPVKSRLKCKGDSVLFPGTESPFESTTTLAGLSRSRQVGPVVPRALGSQIINDIVEGLINIIVFGVGFKRKLGIQGQRHSKRS